MEASPIGSPESRCVKILLNADQRTLIHSLIRLRLITVDRDNKLNELNLKI